MPRLQASFNQSFRDELLDHQGLRHYAVPTPQDLPDALRTERWTTWCEWLDGYDALDRPLQIRVAWLTSKLCFYTYLLTLLPVPDPDEIAVDADAASFAYLRAWCRYRLYADDECPDYSLDEFTTIALHAPPGEAKVDACYQAVVQNAKLIGDLEACELWQPRHEEAIEASARKISDFATQVNWSRFWRVGAFIPQMKRDRDEVARQMTLAETIARELPRRDEIEQAWADEILYPAVESRMQEHRWAQEFDTALEYVGEYVALSPLDARGWLHQADLCLQCDMPERALDSYARVVELGPPGIERGYFGEGACREELGDLDGAQTAYLACLDTDPLAVSAAERLAAVAARRNDRHARDWALAVLAELRRRSEEGHHELPAPYKHIPAPA